MKFMYTNHTNKVEERDVTAMALCYFASPSTISLHLSGYGPGWFLECIAHDRDNALRHFALSHISLALITGEEGDYDGLRLSLPTEYGTTWGNPYDGDTEKSNEYFGGYGVGRVLAEPFRFDASSAWAHGYNDGRRFAMDKRA